MPFAIALSLVGASIKLSAYAKYVFGIRAGTMRPNTATWTLWVFLSSLNSASYLLASGDPYKSAVALAGTTGCVITFAYALRRGSLRPLEGWDRVALAFGILAGVAWIALRSAGVANLILQAGFAISMIPTYRSLLADPDSEKPAPWLLMAAAYAVNACVVVLRWNGIWFALAYPLLNMVTHAGVGLLSFALLRRARPYPAHEHVAGRTPEA
ncbi:MAG: hypothetical protein RLZZ324_523 [Candidatus Parcubacteria bacterium]|jgi:hypothetical protein